MPVDGIKTEVINVLGPWKTVGRVEWETLKWANWCNNERLHSAIGYITPQEAEEAFYANLNNISVIKTRKHRVTTDSNHKFNIAPNLLNRNFTADRPNQKWVVDISYI